MDGGKDGRARLGILARRGGLVGSPTRKPLRPEEGERAMPDVSDLVAAAAAAAAAAGALLQQVNECFYYG